MLLTCLHMSPLLLWAANDREGVTVKRYVLGTVACAAAVCMVSACSDSAVEPQAATATVTSEVEVTTETSTETETVTITPTPTSAPTQLGDVDGTDVRGFVNTPARCDRGDAVIVAARTGASTSPPTKTGSIMVICQTQQGELYYRGARDRPGDKGLTVSNVFKTSDGYVATVESDSRGDKYDYVIERTNLRIAQNNILKSDEPVLQLYWEY